jgi:hypothetical protein
MRISSSTAKKAEAARRYPNRNMSLTQISEGILGMVIPVYPSDVNDAEWALLAPLIPTSKPGGRPRSSDMRRITNGVFYVLRTGCAWRYLLREYGAWQTV